jgi:hypothetical protein
MSAAASLKREIALTVFQLLAPAVGSNRERIEEESAGEMRLQVWLKRGISRI